MGRSHEIGEKDGISMMYATEKKKLLEFFFFNTCEAEKCLLEERYEDIGEWMDRRETIIKQINQLDCQVVPSEKEKAREGMQLLLNELVGKEAVLKQLMIQKKNELSREMQKLNLSKKTNDAYRGNGYFGEGMFFDTTLKPK